MALPTDPENIITKELEIGKNAAKVVQRYVKHKISQNLTIRNIGKEDADGKIIKPILKATSVKPKPGTHRLLGLNLTSNEYGFMQHFGASHRTEHLVKLSSKTVIVRRSHPFKLKSKGIFDDIYQKSGALKILATGLSQTRTQAVFAKIKNLVVELNKQDNG